MEITARLEEAVAAYRDALKERTRERVPLDWAGTQNNLGNGRFKAPRISFQMASVRRLTAISISSPQFSQDQR
jgi:hypothetical protein